MNDIQKLKYDLAMQCALIDTISKCQKDSCADIRNLMFDNFQSHYTAFCMMDQTRFKDYFKNLRELERLSPGPHTPSISF